MVSFVDRCIVFVTVLVLLVTLIYVSNVRQQMSKHHLSGERRLRNAKEIRDDASDYKIVVFDAFLTPEECEAIIAHATDVGLSAAETLDVGSSALSSYNPSKRSSKTCWVQDGVGEVYADISRIASLLSGMPVANNEPLQVAAYDKDGKFDEHYDACDSSAMVCDRFNRGSGQRVATLLIYLNDAFAGGTTTFTTMTPQVSIRPSVGKAIYFEDSIDGTIIPQSKHRGDTVLEGNKWICTKWVHSGVWK